MSLVNKKVLHNTFGEGKVVSYDDAYIKINFDKGPKSFIFPDVFKKYIKIMDEKAAKLVEGKIEEKEAEKAERKAELKKQREKEREEQRLLEIQRRMRSRKIHPALQSVFWCKEEEIDEIFSDWQIFVGEIKSGEKKGEPRRLARMNQNSACLITRRDDDMDEEERHVLGLFMTQLGFDGRKCEDGYIEAHPEYRIKLTQEESEKILFWNYYYNKRSPERITWNSGRQRYFDNIWMAQILRDIVFIKEDPQEQREVGEFFEHFCKINRIDENQLPAANGSLKRKDNSA